MKLDRTTNPDRAGDALAAYAVAALIERRRAAEAECARHVLQARKVHRLAVDAMLSHTRAHLSLQDGGDLHGAIHDLLEGKCAQAWIDEQLAVERAEIERRLGNAPPFCPTHRHYKGGLYEFLCVRPHEEWAGQVDGKPRFAKIETEKPA